LFDDLEDSILNGRGLANSLITAGFVPPVAAEMVLTAERTGTLGMVTELMGEHYEEEGETKLRDDSGAAHHRSDGRYRGDNRDVRDAADVRYCHDGEVGKGE
jgi:hypothetical protein